MLTLPSSTLHFGDCEIAVTDINGTPWLRGYQIGTALGLADPAVAIRKIFKRHSTEFTNDMTAVVEMGTAGGRQLVRLFSPRGAAALAIFAKTERAASFRAWVLDVLESRTAASIPALPAPITASPSVEALLAPQAKAALRYARLGLTSGEIGRLLSLKSTATRSLLRRLRAAQLLPVAGVSHHG